MDWFGRNPVRIPTPHFVVFYNGIEPRPDVEIMYLSSAFTQPTDEPELELKFTAYNISIIHNKSLPEKSPVLKGYMIFIGKVRQYIKKVVPLKKAIEQAIQYCIQNHILENFFRKRKAEVKKMTTLDFTFKREISLQN